MIRFEVVFETPRGHYMIVVINAEGPTHAQREVEKMIQEFGDEAILSGKIYKPENFLVVRVVNTR